jgi:hypothetical protein
LLNVNCDHSVSPALSPGDPAWVCLGLKNEEISSIAVDPTNANIIYAGSLYNFSEGTPGRLFKSLDGGRSWDTLITSYGSQFMQIVIDPKNHNVIHVASWGLIKSSDGGATWQDETNGIQVTWETHVGALAIDPANSNILYAGTAGPSAGRLYKTTDAGASWKAFEGDSLGDGILSIALDPQNSSVVYICTEFNGMLAKSTDKGIHWQWLDFAGNGLFETIAIDPGNPKRILAGSAAGQPFNTVVIWISEDDGVSFQPFVEGIPDSVVSCSSLLFDPALPFDVYEGGYGVFHRTGRNTSWVAYNQGFPVNSRVNVITLGQDYNLYAGLKSLDSLRAGGIYRRKIPY